MVRTEDKGDIFKSSCQTLVCPVNTVGVMGAGLALAFRKRVPGLYTAYQEACRNGELTTSKVWIYKDPRVPFHVLCFASKEHWRNPSKREYVENSLKDLAERHEELGITSLAIPPVGCGLGQMDYIKCVKPLLMQYLDPLEIPVDILFI